MLAPLLTAESEAYAFVLAGIRTGRYAPGERLVPDEIATRLAMSRMPVREALRRLATEGLVTLRANRSCVVTELTIDQIYEVFEIRSVLEGLAVRLATPRLDRRAFSEIEHRLRQMDEMAAGVDDWITHHREFHECVCSHARRPKLLAQITSLHVAIEPYLRIWLQHVAKPLSARAEHQLLIDALRSGDPFAAERAFASHIVGTAPELAPFASNATFGR